MLLTCRSPRLPRLTAVQVEDNFLAPCRPVALLSARPLSSGSLTSLTGPSPTFAKNDHDAG